MPNDYVTLKALVSETNLLLFKGRINKIVVLTDSSVALFVRANGKNHTLLISTESAKARMHLTSRKLSFQETPNAFCMLLRKYLENSIINNIELLNNDRIISINCSVMNELHDESMYRLIIEIMGGGSNIILTDKNYLILDAEKRIYDNTDRCIFPHQEYKFPIMTKLPIDSILAMQELTSARDERERAEILKKICGLAQESVVELILRCKSKAVSEVLIEFCDLYSQPSFSPVVTIDLNGVIHGFYAFPYISVNKETRKYSSLNEALDEYYTQACEADKKHLETHELRLSVKRCKQKLERRLNDYSEKISKKLETERLLQQAEILKGYIFGVSPKEDFKMPSVIECYDYYNDQNISLELNPLLSAQENLSSYFKRYKKLKAGIAHAEKEIEETKLQLEYIKSIEAGIENCDSNVEYAELRQEIKALQFANSTNIVSTRKKPKESQPITFSIDGFRCYIGKNNKQNALITFDIAKGNDVWVHSKDYHGAHGVIISSGQTVPLNIIETVASYVAFFCQARSSDKVEIVYTLRKFVKKTTKLGMVTYVNYKSITVKPKKL
ncbi:MAG: NFACT family protein [Christensenellaceae bacterium]|jgi:predicted ribosome quality control (RQC) complex YloA/Tae2 family protein|nr:NFACT family protein [Christensenellaceae bacterium]